MQYYKQKSEAGALIHKLYLEGLSFEEIEYKVFVLYGFEDKFVKKRIDKLEKLGEIMKKKEVSENDSSANGQV